MSEPYRIGKLTRKRTDGSSYWSYCIRWQEKGAWLRRSLDTTDRVTAEASARAFWAHINAPKELGTVGSVVDLYLASEPTQARRKREAWKAAEPYWRDVRLAAVDETTSLAYLGWRQRSTNTHRHELSLVRTALNWAARRKHIPDAPKIILPPMPETSVTHLTKEQFRKFLAGCGSPHVKLFAMLAVTTGGRKSAILEAKWSQVDFDRKLFQLNPEGRKQNSKYRATVPLNDMIMPALREARRAALTEYVIEHRGEPLADIKKGIAAASERSKIKAHPHMFRHSAAVWMAEDRVPMSEIAAFLGHRDINVTTKVYAKYHPDFLRQAARSLTW